MADALSGDDNVDKEILLYLDDLSLVMVSQSNRYINKLSKVPELWRRKLLNRYDDDFCSNSAMVSSVLPRSAEFTLTIGTANPKDTYRLLDKYMRSPKEMYNSKLYILINDATMCSIGEDTIIRMIEFAVKEDEGATGKDESMEEYGGILETLMRAEDSEESECLALRCLYDIGYHKAFRGLIELLTGHIYFGWGDINLVNIYNNGHHELLMDIVKMDICDETAAGAEHLSELYYLLGKNGEIEMVKEIHKHMNYYGESIYFICMLNDIIRGVIESKSPKIEIIDVTLPIRFQYVRYFNGGRVPQHVELITYLIGLRNQIIINEGIDDDCVVPYLKEKLTAGIDQF